MRRIAFFIVFACLLVLILFVAARLFIPVKDFAFLLTKPIMSFVSGVSKNTVSILNVGELVEENEDLRSRLENFNRLSFERGELELENERLRALLGFKTRLAQGLRKAIACQVIGRSPAGWRDTLIIDKGSAEGLEVGMAVVSYTGLIGRVGEVTTNTSKVRLMSHPRLRVGALLQRTRHTGVVYGTVSGECRMKYISMHADVQEGDVVETAGLSADFPKGLLIGSIERVWKEPGQIYRVASVKLAADIDRLEEVLCVVR